MAIMKTYRMLGVAFTLASVGGATRLGAQQTTGERLGTSASCNSITIHQELDFQVGPQRLYEALLDSKQFSAFSGRPADIVLTVGGTFSLFGGHIVGRNVELVPNQRIVQVWRVVDWPAGAYSIVKFELKGQEGSTHLVFDHTGFPRGYATISRLDGSPTIGRCSRSTCNSKRVPGLMAEQPGTWVTE